MIRLKNRNLINLVVYVLFIAICTQCLINIADSFAQFRDPFIEDGEYALSKERKEFKSKEVSNNKGADGQERDNLPPPGTQMGQRQIKSILKVLPQRGNLLVWGLGYDSPFWHKSTRGRVVFIESDGDWFENVTTANPYLEAYKVTYTTHQVNSFYIYLYHRELWPDLDLRSQLPKFISDIYWHVIIVDAPKGFGDGPGRYQSIYTSSLLAKKERTSLSMILNAAWNMNTHLICLVNRWRFKRGQKLKVLLYLTFKLTLLIDEVDFQCIFMSNGGDDNLLGKISEVRECVFGNNICLFVDTVILRINVI